MISLLLPWLSAVFEDFSHDEHLVRRLQSRDPQAMADVYDRFGKLVYALILRVVRNSAAAEDLTQETFIRLWNRVQAFDAAKGALGPWLLTIARNRAIDYLRSAEGRNRESVVELQRLEQPELFCDFEREILNIDRVRLLKDAFTKLTANQKLVIELAYYEGLSQSEMAERLRQPLGTVKTWMRAALKTLRAELDEAALA